MRVGEAAANCDGGAGACVVARRALRFLPHTELLLPIVMRQDYEGVVCEASSTCLDAACVSAVIADPHACEAPLGCGDATLAPTGAGGAAGEGGSGGGGPDGEAGGPAGIVQVATGETPFFLKDGTVYAYGGKGLELEGLGPNGPLLAIPPVAVLAPAGLRFLDVQANEAQVMALDEKHTVSTWGNTMNGGSGSGMDGGDPTTPFHILVDVQGQPFDHVVAVSPASNFEAAIKDDGTPWLWGDLSGGLLGDGTAGA